MCKTSDDAGRQDASENPDDERWSGVLDLLEPKYDQVREDLQRSTDGANLRASLLVSTSAIVFGVLAADSGSPWRLVSLVSAVAAGIFGVIGLWSRSRDNYDVHGTRKSYESLRDKGDLPSVAETREYMMETEEGFIEQSIRHVARVSLLIKIGFTLLVGSLVLALLPGLISSVIERG
ncbi:hypothetical protein GCG21_08715 [Pseudactinotalea sp. HY160]|uniref:hypothetical protein n=1 Tax=Pseudactinotalea sp. HY160 TaxID=2654490 RepID=UPI00128B2807|nr:hypothetical protein [Pseudactinotalea sp. HY160]MPV50086.1 hypothetical protein [Pseudactinotalea sp. HY160]